MKDEEKKARADRFAFDPVKPEETEPVEGADGVKRKPGDAGFLEALAEKGGFEIKDLRS